MSEERFDTRNFERYAMSVLMEFYCREWDCFRYGQGVESPDLQCEKLSIGIEVTRAIDRENGIPAEIIFEYFGNWNQTKQESWHSIRLWKDKALFSAHNSPYEFMIHLDTLHNSNKIKTEKLNRSYRIFRQNHLYIFTFNPAISPEEVFALWKELEQEFAGSSMLQYDLLFLDCVDRLIVLKRKTGQIEEIFLDAKRLHTLQQKAFA